MQSENSYNFAELRKHQLKAVKALENIDAVCRKYSIKYFLIAGSTLGAVRHKGFIPWDDDIDIGMRLEDFNRFKAVIQFELSKEFAWKHTDVDPTFPTLSGRILSDGEQLITIFPIVRISNNKLVRISQWLIRKTVSPIYQRKVHYIDEGRWDKLSYKAVYFISLILSVFFTRHAALKLLRWNERRCENKETEFCINLYSKYSMQKEMIKSEWIEHLNRIPFEGGLYPVFANYDEYLTYLYGNYMQLPPEAERIPDHL
ncbi:MAG TPA: LicD family protein [Clostridiales bacterium]|nr:LicD family protein [Clostridiales bacterium]